MDRSSKVRMDKSKFLSIPSCSRKEFQSIVDVMMENVPNGDGKLPIFCFIFVSTSVLLLFITIL